MAKKCCPRIHVVCKKFGGEKVSQTFWTLKGPFAKPVQHTASATIPARVKCAVKLGKRVVSPYVFPQSNKLDNAIERYKKSLSSSGCADTSVTRGKIPSEAPIRFRIPRVTESDTIDKLNARINAKIRGR